MAYQTCVWPCNPQPSPGGWCLPLTDDLEACFGFVPNPCGGNQC